MKKYTIQEVTKKVNMPSSTLRFYESKGLLPKVDRTDSGYRLYTDDDIEILKLIDCLKKTNMSLKDISQFVEWTNQGETTVDDRRRAFSQRKKAVQKQIKDLHEIIKSIDERMKALK